MRRFASVKTIINYKLLVYEEDLPIYSYDLVFLASGHGTTSIANRERLLAKRVFGPPQRKPLSLSCRRARSGTLGVSTIFLENFFTQSGSRVIRSWTESPTRNCMMETW